MKRVTELAVLERKSGGRASVNQGFLSGRRDRNTVALSEEKCPKPNHFRSLRDGQWDRLGSEGKGNGGSLAFFSVSVEVFLGQGKERGAEE